jgi:hypothetical protein
MLVERRTPSSALGEAEFRGRVALQRRVKAKHYEALAPEVSGRRQIFPPPIHFYAINILVTLSKAVFFALEPLHRFFASLRMTTEGK